MGGFAWVTLATNDSYSLGALVLAHSLRRVGTKHDLAVLVTPGVTGAMREKLSSIFSMVQEVNVLDSKDEANLALLARPELGITFTKLHCWRLTQYEKCVFVDADTLVVRNCDELFEREELSAAPDVGWPDCFNSGVFVFKPSQQTFASLTSFAASKGSFDGGDQGLLNQYFSDWAQKDMSKHLPFIYNMCSTATYSYLPAFKQYGEDARIVHFIGITKPWLQYFDTLTGQVHPGPGVNHLQPLLQLWWNIFCENVHPQLTPIMSGVAGALAKLTLGEARSSEQVALEEHVRKQNWEQGQIDYMGRDSFDNIWKKISETLAVQQERQPSPPKTPTPKSDKSKLVEPIATPSTVDETDTKSNAAPQSEADRTSLQDPADELARTVEKSIESANPSSLRDVTIARQVPIPKVPYSTIPECTMPPLQSSKSNEPGPAIGPTTIAKDSTISRSPEALLNEEKADPARRNVPEFEKVESPQSSGPASVEILSECQVPIQVAESVLEADVKESISEVLRPVKEEALSSVSLAAQESVPAVLETPVEAPERICPMSSDSSGLRSEIGNGLDSPLEVAPGRTRDANDPSRTGRSVEASLAGSSDAKATVLPKEAKTLTSVSEIPPLAEIDEAASSPTPIAGTDPISAVSRPTIRSTTNLRSQSPELTSTEADLPAKLEELEISPKYEESSVSSNVPSDFSAAAAADPPPSLSCPPKPMKRNDESSLELEAPKDVSIAKSSSSIDDDVRESSTTATEAEHDESSSPSPIRPVRTRDLQIPDTPTITEPTPPTSPPIDGASTLEEAQTAKVAKKAPKKIARKSSVGETGEAEAEGKKVTKKSGKKTKKKDEDGNGTDIASAGEKPKKIVKIAKKGPKTTSQTLDAEAVVPETPPPGTTEIPIPPKRKIKTAVKTTSQKSDPEP